MMCCCDDTVGLVRTGIRYVDASNSHGVRRHCQRSWMEDTVRTVTPRSMIKFNFEKDPIDQRVTSDELLGSGLVSSHESSEFGTKHCMQACMQKKVAPVSMELAFNATHQASSHHLSSFISHPHSWYVPPSLSRNQIYCCGSRVNTS